MPKTAAEGEPSFDSLKDDDAFLEFWKENFKDTVHLIPDLEEQVAKRKIGFLVETEIYPWSIGKVCLMGDACHSLLPFFGLGFNTALEDCLCLDHFMDVYNNDFEKAFNHF